MTPRAARAFAERVHGRTLDRYGVPLMNHVRRVVADVPAHAKAVAWLHEVLECSHASVGELRRAGASEDEVAAVRLLTRDTRDEVGYAEHIRSIAEAPGRSGALARTVKRSDLADRLRHQHDASGAPGPGRPPYRYALESLTAEAMAR